MNPIHVVRRPNCRHNSVFIGHDWSKFIEYVVRDLEGDVTEGAVEKREKMLREKIKDIIPCDATKSDSFFDAEYEKCQYDIVQSNCCLGVVRNSPEAYREGVVKLASYVKPGGYMQLLTSAGGEGGYVFGGVKDIDLYVLNVDSKDGIRGMEMAGESAWLTFRGCV
jgi:hypothetical protein